MPFVDIIAAKSRGRNWAMNGIGLVNFIQDCL